MIDTKENNAIRAYQGVLMYYLFHGFFDSLLKFFSRFLIVFASIGVFLFSNQKRMFRVCDLVLTGGHVTI